MCKTKLFCQHGYIVQEMGCPISNITGLWIANDMLYVIGDQHLAVMFEKLRDPRTWQIVDLECTPSALCVLDRVAYIGSDDGKVFMVKIRDPRTWIDKIFRRKMSPMIVECNEVVYFAGNHITSITFDSCNEIDCACNAEGSEHEGE